MAELQKLIWAAKRPIAILGGSRWSAQAVQRFARFAERFALPVTTSFRRQMLFPADHPAYAGDFGIGPNPKLLARLKDADLVLLVGGRMSEMPSQSYTLFDIPTPRQPLVHVHPDAGELGRVYRPHLAINASPIAFSAALEGVQPPHEIPWAEETRKAHADFLAWTDPAVVHPPGRFRMNEAMAHLRRTLPADTIICNGAGNFAVWAHRFWRLPALRHAARPDLRLDGLRRAGRGRREADVPGPHRRLPCRRRRLPDERPGVRDRGAVRAAARRDPRSTTACTAPSACTRSASIRAASRRRC